MSEQTKDPAAPEKQDRTPRDYLVLRLVADKTWQEIGTFRGHGNDEAREKALEQCAAQHVREHQAKGGAPDKAVADAHVPQFDPSKCTLATVAVSNWAPKTPKVEVKRSTSWV